MHFASAKGIIAQNTMNVFRGCTHGCIYCDSRSHCYQMLHDFEDIEVKQNAAELLEKTLSTKRKKSVIRTGWMCDPYIPIEENLRITRECLKIVEKHGFGLAIHTKSARILRDLDILTAINQKAPCTVQITLTTKDEKLCKIIEPDVSSTVQRVEALKILHQHGIPTVVWLCPFLPFINDDEENLLGLLDDCVSAGVAGIICFGIEMTLRAGSREYFYAALHQHFPGLLQRYCDTYGDKYVLKSPNHDRLMPIFHAVCEENKILHHTDEVFRFMHTYVDKQEAEQIKLF